MRCTTSEPRTPSDEELRLIESAADVARIAIEQQRAHQALRHSEARNRAMLRAIPDWMFLTTVDGVFLDYHARDASSLHVPPSAFLGKNVREVLPPPLGETLAQAFVRVGASDEPEKIEYTLGSDDSERFYEACIVRCDGDKILSIVRDITDRKRAELEAGAQTTGTGASEPGRDARRAHGCARARIESAADGCPQQRAGGTTPPGS